MKWDRIEEKEKRKQEQEQEEQLAKDKAKKKDKEETGTTGATTAAPNDNDLFSNDYNIDDLNNIPDPIALSSQASQSWADFLDVSVKQAVYSPKNGPISPPDNINNIKDINNNNNNPFAIESKSNEISRQKTPDLTPEVSVLSDSEMGQTTMQNTQEEDYILSLKYLKKCQKLNSFLPIVKNNYYKLHDKLLKYLGNNFKEDELDDEKSMSEVSHPSGIGTVMNADNISGSGIGGGGGKRRSLFGKDKNQGYVTFQSQLSAATEMSIESDIK